MATFNTDREVLERVASIREAHGIVRAEVACRIALSIAYANSRQWNRVERDEITFDLDQFPMDENINPHSNEIRVVDNRIAPLMRRVAASTNATRIEASVHPPKHRRGLKEAHVAKVAQNALNGLDESGGFTRAARKASFNRWLEGSRLIKATLSRKGREVSADVATHPDGSPIEMDDQWIRWESLPIFDLLWDPYTHSDDLDDHNELVYERILTVRKFTQLYGTPESHGFKTDDLPKIGDLAPHARAAANINGCGTFDSFVRHTDEKGLRVSEFMVADPHDPGLWPENYIIIDTTPHQIGQDNITGKVVNMDNAMTPYGYKGRPIMKLDAFKTGESVWAWSIPTLLMGNQDITNIVKSLQIQQLTNAIFGMWVIDRRGGMNKEAFTTQLADGIGGVIEWDSGGSKDGNPPQWMNPQNAVNTDFTILAAAEQQAMDGQVHISPANKGISKSHVPQDTASRILDESKVVVDNIIGDDKSQYQDLLKVTLGTFRKAMDQPNRMIARLRDTHDFGQSEIESLLTIDPVNINLDVMVREDTIISRSVQERKLELDTAVGAGIIGREEYIYASANDLERPLTQAHGSEVQFIQQLVVGIMNGREFEGMPSIEFKLFQLTARRAIHGMDPNDDGDFRRISIMETAIEKQRQIAIEKVQQEQGLLDDQAGQGPQQPQEVGLVPSGGGGGSPESINPLTSPVGAAGGLPLGLSG